MHHTGRYDEINKLLGDFSQNEAALQQLMGNNRAEHERKLKEKLARRQKRIEQGKYSCLGKVLLIKLSWTFFSPVFEILRMETLHLSTTGLDPDDTDDEDDSDDVQKKGSVLDDLNNRFEDEKEALLARLRGTSGRF